MLFQIVAFTFDVPLSDLLKLHYWSAYSENIAVCKLQ